MFFEVDFVSFIFGCLFAWAGVQLFSVIRICWTGRQYGVKHYALHLDEVPLWMNFGYWPLAKNKDDQQQQQQQGTFASACIRLAEMVGERAHLSSIGTGRLLDVGCGCGEEISLFADKFGVQTVVAFNPVATQIRQAQRLLSKRVSRHPLHVVLRVEDIMNPKGPVGEPASFHAVVCVDAAYHFNSRIQFLCKAHELLVPGGRLALCDLLLLPKFVNTRSMAARLLAWAVQIPASNYPFDIADYRAALNAAGFDPGSVQVEDITERTIQQFSRYAAKQTDHAGALVGVETMLPFSLVGRALAWLVEHRYARYVIVSAAKRKR